jgi:hypothetical protein
MQMDLVDGTDVNPAGPIAACVSASAFQRGSEFAFGDWYVDRALWEFERFDARVAVRSRTGRKAKDFV